MERGSIHPSRNLGLARFTATPQREALLHWNRAANQGNVDARVKLGDYFYYGVANVTDFKKSIAYYRAAESDSSAIAMFNLGYMHENGIGVEQDYHLAKRFYDLALATNSDAYFPVSLALVKLNVKYFFHWLRHGGSFFLDAPAPIIKDGSSAADSSPALDGGGKESAEDTHTHTTVLNEGPSATFEDDLFGGGENWSEEDSNETIIILILAFIAGAILLQRQQPPQVIAMEPLPRPAPPPPTPPLQPPPPQPPREDPVPNEERDRNNNGNNNHGGNDENDA